MYHATPAKLQLHVMMRKVKCKASVLLQNVIRWATVMPGKVVAV